MEKSSFFNAELVGEEYDRTYLAEDYAQYFASFIGNGVFPNPSNNLQIIADGTSMNVVLSMGKAWINGYFYTNTTDKALVIAPADGVLNRIDRVVLRLDFLNREIKVYVKQGAFASTPTAPSLQRDADMYEIALADIKVNKGVIKITQANITDLRQDNNYCGIVHGTVDQVDVTTLFNQYENALELKEQGFEEEFTTWFNNIKGQLEGDVAANLAGQIADINEQLGEMEKYALRSQGSYVGDGVAGREIIVGFNPKYVCIMGFTNPTAGVIFVSLNREYSLRQLGSSTNQVQETRLSENGFYVGGTHNTANGIDNIYCYFIIG